MGLSAVFLISYGKKWLSQFYTPCFWCLILVRLLSYCVPLLKKSKHLISWSDTTIDPELVLFIVAENMYLFEQYDESCSRMFSKIEHSWVCQIISRVSKLSMQIFIELGLSNFTLFLIVEADSVFRWSVLFCCRHVADNQVCYFIVAVKRFLIWATNLVYFCSKYCFISSR